MENTQQGGNAKKWVFGCCGGLIVLLFLLIGVGYFGAGYAKDRIATEMRISIGEDLEESNISEEQRALINSELERLEAALRGWSALEALKHLGNLDQVAEEMQTIAAYGVMGSFELFVLPHTQLPGEERIAAQRTLQRYTRALDERKLLFGMGSPGWQLINKKRDGPDVEIDPGQVRAHLAQLKTQVDAAEIPDEPYQGKPAATVTRIVDTIIGAPRRPKAKLRD